MENKDINETSGQTPERSVEEFKADNYSLKVVDTAEKYVKYETEVIDNYIFHSIVEIPKATDQRTILLSLKDDEYPPKDFFLNYNSRLNTNPFQCLECDAKFKSNLDLDQHIEKKHINNIKIPAQNVLNPDDAYDINFIDESNSNETKSDFTSKFETFTEKHKKLYSDEYVEEYVRNIPIPIPEYKCSVPLPQNVEKSSTLCHKCGIMFENINLYTQHVNSCKKRQCGNNDVNDKKFAKKCTINSTSTVTDRKLRSHSNIFIKQEPVEIDYSDGLTADNIKKELTSEHKCNVCQKQFVNANNLTKHMHIHTASQILYNCELCHRTFKNRGHLTNHMRGFQCPVKIEQLPTRNDVNPKNLVNTRATNSQTKQNKLAAAHNTIQNKYKCDDCGERFPSNFFLGVHIMHRHPQAEI